MDPTESFDFIVCGAGSAGCVVAARLSEHAHARVLLLEAGGTDAVASVREPQRWPENLRSERDWQFTAEANPALHGRAIPLSMGRVLGGGSSINALQWMRGHQADWDFFAREAQDDSWGFASIRRLFARVEKWNGAPDPAFRGQGGPVPLEPALARGEATPILVEAAHSIGIPVFPNANGAMAQSAGGASVLETITYQGERYSAYRSYVEPVRGRPNLVVLTGAHVQRIVFAGHRACAVEALVEGKLKRFQANA